MNPALFYADFFSIFIFYRYAIGTRSTKCDRRTEKYGNLLLHLYSKFTKNMIEFRDTSFVYDKKLLFEHFTETIGDHEKVVFSGPSGIGKSTLLSAILGFTHPNSGSIFVDNMPVDAVHIGDIRKRTAYLPQEFMLPYQTVKELIRSPYELKINRQNKFSEERMFELFDRLQLEHDLYEKQVHEISGGQRQRIMLIAVLMLKRPILLIDEPTSALDSQSIERTIELLKTDAVRSMIAISHDARFISAFDRNIKIG